MTTATSKMIDDVRQLTARLINAPDEDRVVFTFNCTDSLNLGLKGLLEKGDHVITSTLEHNSVIRPLSKLEKQGVKVSRISPRLRNEPVSPEDIENEINKQTRLVMMTHASNVNGVIQPIREYGEITRRHDINFMVDAAQTAGRYALDVQENNIDLMAFSGHKGPMGPTGIGVLYISERVELDSLREGGTGSQSELEEQPSVLPNKFECGTANTIGIAGLGAGLRFVLEKGMEKILAQEQSLISFLIDGLSRTDGVTVYGAKERDNQAPIVSFTIDGSEPGEIAAVLDQAFDIKARSGLHCSPVAHKTLGTFPKGTVRLSPGYFNTTQEIELALQAIQKIAKMESL
jgi:cysteine desulfurase family protein